MSTYSRGIRLQGECLSSKAQDKEIMGSFWGAMALRVHDTGGVLDPRSMVAAYLGSYHLLSI